MSPSELEDFGVVYDPSAEEKDDDLKTDEDALNPKKRKKGRKGRRKKLQFQVEETKENQVLFNDVETQNEDLQRHKYQMTRNRQSDYHKQKQKYLLIRLWIVFYNILYNQ